MAPPMIGAPLRVRIPPDLRARADALAAVRGVPVAELIRRALAEYLDREGQT